MIRRYQSLLLIALATPMWVAGFANTNFFRPYEPATRIPLLKGTHFHLGLSNLEYGEGKNGHNTRSKKRNILQLHNETESAIPMILNAADQTVINTLAAGTLIPILTAIPNALDDDGDRGHQRLTGKFNGLDATFFFGYTSCCKKIPGHLTFTLYVPVAQKEVRDVKITDLTPTTRTGITTAAADLAVKNYLTNDLAKLTKQLGNLDLSNWSKTGVGDITLMAEWTDTYKQDKDYLNAVSVFMHAGVLFPSAEKKDEDKAFSLPMGSDGAWGLPIGLGLLLDLKACMQFGADVDFLVLFDETRDRRMKTNLTQTEFLLLNKGRATKEFGLNWQFHLYLQAFHFWRGLSAKFSYEYLKRDEDRLTPKGNAFDYSIVNSASSLSEQTVHNLIFKTSYDFEKECGKCKPQVSVFYKLPVAARNYIDHWTVGGQLAVNF